MLEDAATELNMREKNRKYIALKAKLDILQASVSSATTEVQEARAAANEARRQKAEDVLTSLLGDFRSAIEEARLEQFRYDQDRTRAAVSEALSAVKDATDSILRPMPIDDCMGPDCKDKVSPAKADMSETVKALQTLLRKAAAEGEVLNSSCA